MAAILRIKVRIVPGSTFEVPECPDLYRPPMAGGESTHVGITFNGHPNLLASDL